MAKAISHILCATDLESTPRAVLDTAATLAKSSGATLTLLHVLRPPAVPSGQDLNASTIEHLQKRARARSKLWHRPRSSCGDEATTGDSSSSHTCMAAASVARKSSLIAIVRRAPQQLLAGHRIQTNVAEDLQFGNCQDRPQRP